MNRCNLAIVGLGWGQKLIQRMPLDGADRLFRLAAVCDTNRSLALEAAKRFGVKAYFEIDSLLQDAEIGAIGLFTPPEGRADLIDRIIRAGRDVLTTKPFELDPEKALNVLLQARRLRRVVHMNSPAPLPTADLQQMLRWREQYSLGRPIACRMETWASYREQADGSWKDDPQRCPGGPLFRLGIYLINDLVRLLGPAESAQTMAARVFTQRPTPDNAQLSIRFRNGALAVVFASFCIDDGQPYRNSMILNYERGTICRNTGCGDAGASNRMAFLELSARDAQGARFTERATVEECSGAYPWQAFHRAIHGESLSGEIVPEEIVEGLKIIRAMSRSERSGRAEPV